MAIDISCTNIDFDRLFNMAETDDDVRTSIFIKSLDIVGTLNIFVGYEKALISRLNNHFTKYPPLKSYHDLGYSVVLEGGIDLSDKLSRYPSELGAMYLYNTLLIRDININDIIACSRLLGGFTTIRVSGNATYPFLTGHRFVFESYSKLEIRMKNLLNTINSYRKNCTIIYAYRIYLELLAIHPLQDGNGRLARALLNAILCINLGFFLPVLPISVPLIIHRPNIFRAYLALYLSNDPKPFISLMNICLINAALIIKFPSCFKQEMENGACLITTKL